MGASVVYSSTSGAVMASIPAVKTHLVVFGTSVIDLTEQLGDPVEVLFSPQGMHLRPYRIPHHDSWLGTGAGSSAHRGRRSNRDPISIRRWRNNARGVLAVQTHNRGADIRLDSAGDNVIDGARIVIRRFAGFGLGTRRSSLRKRNPTGLSFDYAYMWQALETKARFIDQIITGDNAARRAEDVGGKESSYAEVKAIASGNPAVLNRTAQGPAVPNHRRSIDRGRTFTRSGHHHGTQVFTGRGTGGAGEATRHPAH